MSSKEAISESLTKFFFGQVNYTLGIFDIFGARKLKRVIFGNAFIEIFEKY